MENPYQIRFQIIDFKKGISLDNMTFNVSKEQYDKIRSLSGYNPEKYGFSIDYTVDQPVYLAVRALNERKPS